MDAARWREIEDIYHSALSRAPEDRPAFLREACRGDSDLQQRVQSLLSAEVEAGNFLEPLAAEDVPTERAPQIQIGSYRILHRLGAGGMGEVFRAHDAKLGRDVAMKTLASEFARDADRIARLRREARTLAAVNHPNLAAIHDLIETDAGCYLVLELVEGETLRGPLPLDKALDYARQVAAGLHAAHSKGIVHRDLKPSNVIVTPEGLVKVLDFGLAKAMATNEDARPRFDPATASNSATLTGQIVGTPPYMSPEQMRGEVIDKRTDIWAFGCLLYELLTGRRAFEGKTVTEVVAAVLTRDPDWSVLPKTPGRIRQLLRQCLTKDAARRPPDIEEVGAAVESVISARRGRKHLRIVAAAVTAIAGLTFAAAIVLPRRSTGGEQPIQSVLVIPFENQSHDPHAEYLSDGITEGLINSLSRLPGIRVVARTTAFTYKAKALDLDRMRRELDIDAILTGRLVSQSQGLTVQADLIHVGTKAQIWGDRYQQAVADPLAIEDQIVAAVINHLNVPLTQQQKMRLAERAASKQAYELYLRGRHEQNKRSADGMVKARTYFQQAVDSDPTFAAAYAGLADTYILMGGLLRLLPKEEAHTKAGWAARRALELDPRMAEAHASLGLIAQNEFRWKSSERELRRAIELNPNYAQARLWYSLVLSTLGRPAEALQQMREASRLDPLSAHVAANTARAQNLAGNHEEAIREASKALELNPNSAYAYWQMGLAHDDEGNDSQAAEAYERMMHAPGPPNMARAAVGRAYAKLGRTSEARKIASDLEAAAATGQGAPTQIAWVYAALGENDRAFIWLERALETRDVLLRDSIRSATLRELEDDPRYADLLRRMLSVEK